MNKKLIRKMLTASGGGLVYDDGKNIERTNYNNWSKLSFIDKMKRRFNIAKHLFNESSSPIINSVEAIFGEYDPKNPDLNTGVVYAPSRGINPKTVLNVAKGVRTLEDYLKTTKVSAPVLEGSSMARNSYATDRFIGGRLFLNTLPEEAMKILGHGMAKSPTILDALARLRYILDNGIKGKFYTAPLKVSKEAATAGGAIGTGGATPYFDGHFLITGKPGLMINSVDDIGTVYINDAYENEEALKAALKLLQYLLLTYPKINFKLYSLGFKQGGKMNILEFLKNGSGIHIKEKNKGKFTKYCHGKVTDECIRKAKASGNPTLVKRATFALNSRKWKHKEGGSIEKLEKGSLIKNSLSFLNESGLGKTLLEGGLNFLLNSSQNKSIARATDVAKAELDKEKQEASDYALLMATKKALEMLLIDPNNPNAFGGSIVLNYIRLQLYNEYLNSINLDIANRKALLDMLSLQMLNENTSGAISGIIQSGLGVVGNLLGGKKDTSSTNSTTYNGTSSSTKSIVLPKLTSNKWTPSTSLSNPVLGNNALGSMPNYTSLLNVKK